jgi:hypothetical protein
VIQEKILRNLDHALHFSLTPELLYLIFLMNDHRIYQARILVQRLERLSADSVWAHRASGVRAALDKLLRRIDTGQDCSGEALEALLRSGYQILEKAAQEITTAGDQEEIL